MVSETENAKHSVLIFTIETLDALILSMKKDLVLEKLKCAVKLNVAFSHVLKIEEVGTFGIAMYPKTTFCCNDQNLRRPQGIC